MHEKIVEQVLAALQLGACDVQDHGNEVDDKGNGLIAHENVAIEYGLGTNCFDGSLEIDCHLRVMTPDGPGPQGNTWVLWVMEKVLRHLGPDWTKCFAA